MGFVVFYITHPNEDHANMVANTLIEKKYVACANIYPVSSEYRYEAKVEKCEEWVTLCKTSYDNIERIELLVTKIHSYDVPCITHWEASSNPAYEKWIFSNVLRR